MDHVSGMGICVALRQTFRGRKLVFLTISKVMRGACSGMSDASGTEDDGRISWASTMLSAMYGGEGCGSQPAQDSESDLSLSIFSSRS